MVVTLKEFFYYLHKHYLFMKEIFLLNLGLYISMIKTTRITTKNFLTKVLNVF